MSAFKQVMDCQDLRRHIREFIPPHPIADIIEKEYMYHFKENRMGDVRKICDNIRIKLIKKGGYDAEKKTFTLDQYGTECWFSFQSEAPTENYACLKYWAFTGIVMTFEYLSFIQDGLGLEKDITFYSLFQFNRYRFNCKRCKKMIFKRMDFGDYHSEYIRTYGVICDECEYADDEDYEDSDEDN